MNHNATNPLLDFSGLPRFAQIQPAHVAPAIDELIAACRATVDAVVASGGHGWDDFVAPLEDVNERLSRAWGVVSHLHAVIDSPALRDAYNDNLPKVTEYWTDLGQNLALFNKYRALKAGTEYATLSAPRKKIIDNELRDFRLSGAELPDDKKARFKVIAEEQSMQGSRFSENLLDATNAFSLLVEDEARLAGLPQDVRDAAREAAQKDGKPGWKLTLHAPSYLPVLQYADDRSLRESIYKANVTRASEFGDPKFDNTGLIDTIVALRAEEAGLLGLRNYAEVSLVPKMADTPAQVLAFLNDLGQRARPFAERDYAELKAFAKEQLGLDTLEAWDLMYTSEKLRQQRYAFSDQEVKEYFPEPKVLAGLFKVVETIFDVRILPDPALSPPHAWHDDVRGFRIESTAGQLVGQFYLDLYARDTKRGGAWMDDAITRRKKHNGLQTPVTYLTCNFARGVGETKGQKRPALFTHDDVITLFHEFGHGLHHMLTRVDDLGVSGINGVEWDAVELPSQFMENFCWEWDVIRHMTGHVDTGLPLPRALFDKMLAAKNFQAGMQTVRQIEYSLFDMHLHADFNPSRQTPLQLLDDIRHRVAVALPPDYNRFPNNFSHIFAGGYAAGYYSYKWAEVLSADAYSAFEEEGVLSPAAGARFHGEVLAVGGSRPAVESFRAFRGRDPSIDALLRHSGMIAA
jgi:oligopeptidase A